MPIDITPPILKSITFPSTADVSQGTSAFKITALADGTGSKITTVVLYFDKQITCSSFFDKNPNDTAGTFSVFSLYGGYDIWDDGESFTVYGIKPINENKTLTLMKVIVSDSEGNQSTYLTDDLKSMGISTTFSIVGSIADLTPPTISVTTSAKTLSASQTATIQFTLSEPSINFVEKDVTVEGGTLSNFTGSGTSYSATFTPNKNSTTAARISVANSTFSDAAGNTNTDGYESDNNLYISVDTQAPTISLRLSTSGRTVNSGGYIDIILSESSNNFTISDITVSGGTLSSLMGGGTYYTAYFSPTFNSTADGVLRVASGTFTDLAGNLNDDGLDENNTLVLSVDTVNPTIAITSNVADLTSSKTATITFTLSEPSTNFVLSDVQVSGGTLSNFSGSGTTYVATFTPTINSTANGVIKVWSSAFTDAANNLNTDGLDANNTLTLTVPDISPPTIAISSNLSQLGSGDIAIVTFTLSEPSTNFTVTDLQVTGGTVSNFRGNGVSYSALYIPNTSSNTTGSIQVSSGTFTDLVGNSNQDGLESNNSTYFFINTIDRSPPAPMSYSPKLGELNVDVTRDIVITFNENIQRGSGVLEIRNGHPTQGFLIESFNVATSDRLTFNGSTLTINPTRDLPANYYLFVYLADGAVKDLSDNPSANINGYTITTSDVMKSTPATESHVISVIVDRGVLSNAPVLLTGLKETLFIDNGLVTRHTVEYAGQTFDFSLIAPLITTVTRDGEFATEFTKEINDYVGTELNIAYTTAVKLVGAANINDVILNVAGSDGNYVR